jgi:hypothetical protein
VQQSRSDFSREEAKTAKGKSRSFVFATFVPSRDTILTMLPQQIQNGGAF